MSVKLLHPHDRILLVTASTPAELGRMFLRPQEFFESPRYRGRFFTMKAFERYYRRIWGAGRFSYYRDFGGYNIPGEIFLDWQKAFASNETVEEQALLRLLGPLPDKFYLIGALAKDVRTIAHELSHAFFHLDDYYRGRATAEITIYDLRALQRALRKIMYREEVLDDECVSYILFEEAWMKRQGIKTKVLRPLRRRLQTLYREVVKQHIRPRRNW